jgi:hypothetical protein
MGHRPVFSAGPQGAIKSAVGCGCVLNALLFSRTNEDRGRKSHFVAHKSLRGPPPSDDRHVVCPPRAGPHKSRGSRPWPTFVYALIRPCVQYDLLSSADPLNRKIVSILNIRTGAYAVILPAL